ncbi:MAG: YraN family protein [Actinomycetes bacterium]
MGYKQNLGRAGENLVADLLQSQGNQLLERNWRIREGEIDLIALAPNGVIRFVEVKTRSSEKFGHPLEAINARKAMRLQRLALAWLSTHQHLGAEYQIDCAAVLSSQTGECTIDYRSAIL